ncbi:hypothetical protein N7462_006783 [Penicillium macrosclerotiorum]|uniref:uncharacterized protein n=1 Tax=Penicillium macrosclerotiorum TaxID=303699 RepID=UPI0025470A21|nr:uncharacterized protein N7462_006783 [Penicillium macrosclerotiorum]KAJ5683618.1 hypothetical protein N7462_006783 [Penicillium macrosclerotiorum]
MFLFPLRRCLILTLVPGLLVDGTFAEDSRSRAHTALNTLQEWYNATSGLWDTCGWWNGANCMTVIADFAALDSSVMETAEYVFENTFVQAPTSNPNPGPEVKTVSKRHVLPPRGSQANVNASEWLDSAYDDDGWWALAWIAAYDVTQNNTYLELAEGIFSALTAAWGTQCGGGGVPWSPTSSYVNAITNELFLSVAAHLANRVPSKQDEYIDWAQREWNWFAAQGFMGENHTINDGLLDDCSNNGQTVWSYNQGVVLGGLVELNKAAPNRTYLESANTIAKAAIEALADANMVIHESCEPNDCVPDETQFKGIFIRNLQILHEVSPHDLYKQVINNCADSLWGNDRNSQNQLSVAWAGPFHEPADASTHSSALDALVAAIAV